MMMSKPKQEQEGDVEAQAAEGVVEEVSVEDQLRAELDAAQEARLRALADFKNFQRRSIENEGRAHRSGIAGVVRAILPALEQFAMAIEHAEDDAVVEGFVMARDELLRGLAELGVVAIAPEPGEPFDPTLHEAMLRQPSDEIEENHVVSVLQGGWRLEDQVIQPAKIAVAAAAEDQDDEDA